ncbi:hypothetical protein BGW36DRAFT_465441 [Talaromyces proteolyticus]|uniref:Major facilitator superfamily (MFS) profile domain-containing protein n=1 Tax=Talaromyces proteolyticus TaxID=1131652 RepID=A0AAD4KFJ9_9EURO|nr:uncharacterized protein BGW36DRAFT_465441 [Talaromyces proteolyticus]KAH8690521.1 hypothetical protein BGW36DRAFT_465441 [Talaromyces proteolyticus]
MGCFDRFLGLRNDLKLVGLSLGAFLALIDIYTALISFYTIAIDTQTPWMAIWSIIGHQIAFAASIPFYEGLIDMQYQNAVFIMSSIIFSVSSAAASWTNAAALVAAFRAIKGLGAAGMFTTAAADVSTTACKATRCAKLVGPLWGGIIGAACMEYKGWNWMYWLNGVSGVFSLVCYLCGRRDDEWRESPSRTGFMQLDIAGAILFAIATFLVVAISQTAVDAFYEPDLVFPTFVAVAISLFVIAIFWFWERRSKQTYRFIQIPRNGSNNGALFSRAIHAGLIGFIWDATIFSLTLGYQLVDTPPRFFVYYPALWSAIRLLWIIIPSRVGIFIGAATINKQFLHPNSVSLTGSILVVFSVTMFSLSGRFPVRFFNTLQSIAMGTGFGLHLAAFDYIGINNPSPLSSSSFVLSSQRVPSSDEEEGGGTEDEDEEEEDLEMETEDFLSSPQRNDDEIPQAKLEAIHVFGGVIGISLVHMILHYNCRNRNDCGKSAFEKSFTVSTPLVLLVSVCVFIALFFVNKMTKADRRV